MAKKKRSASSVKVVRVPAAGAAPIIKVSAPRAAPVKHHRRRRRSYGAMASAAGGFVSRHNIDAFTGGAVYGFAVRSGFVDRLPAIPVVGRTGAFALLADYMSRGNPTGIMRKAAVAAATLAGYQLGHDGKITGDLVTSGDSFVTAQDQRG